MTSLVKIAAIIAALVGLVYWLGNRLPVEHTASSAAVYSVPPDSIWKAITDFGRMYTWRSGVSDVELMQPIGGKPAFREKGMTGQTVMVVDDMRKPTRLVTRIAYPEETGYAGSWTFQLERADAGSRLTITERGEVYNPIFRFLSRYVIGQHRSIDGYLKSLGRRFRQSAQPEHVEAA